MQNGGRHIGRERSDQAESAARHVIQPLVRSCLQVGLSAEAIRGAVEAAIEEGQKAPGIAESAAEPGLRQDLADLARVLSAWHTRPEYVDENGVPRLLPRRGSPPSFEALARMANPSLEPQFTLDRLVLGGAVSIDNEQRIRVLRREFLSREWDEVGLWSWRESARRLLETLEFNYTAAGVGRFERAARSERLPKPLLPVFNAWVREHAEEFLRMADDWLTQHEMADEDDDLETVTTGVGIYLFVDERAGPP
jgi:hypothetical protein